MSKLRLLMPIVIATLLGPLVAGLAVCLLAICIAVIDLPTAPGLADMAKLFSLYMIFAYLEGGPIALVAGILVTIWMAWRSPPTLPVSIGAGLASVILFRLAAGAGMLSAPAAVLVRYNLVLALALSAVAAGTCWLLARWAFGMK